MNALIELRFNRFGTFGCTYTVHGRHAVVFLDDLMRPSGFRPGTLLTEMLLRFGDVITVEYPVRWGFGGKCIARELTKLAAQYEEVTFIGMGTGAVLANDAIERLDKQEGGPLVRLILADGVSSLDDLRVDLKRRAVNATFVPWFPVPRWLNKRRNAESVSVKHDETLDGRSILELDVHREVTAEFPYGTYLRQLAYVANRPEPKKETLQDIPAVYIQSSKDFNSPVKRWAYDCWEALFGGSLPRIKVEPPVHCGILEYPTDWCAAFLAALEELNLQPSEDD